MKKLSILLSFVFIGCATSEKSCQIKRQALYDIGSGSTKLTLVETNTCDPRPKVLLNTSEKVDYKEDLLKSKKAEFSEQIQALGISALKKIKSQATEQRADEHRGIATAAFREAKNAGLLVDQFKNELGIPIEIISQEQEARLSFLAVRLYNSEPELLVWDIGGASFQLTSQDAVFKGSLASVVFKDLILKEVKRKRNLQSPNPMSLIELHAARNLVAKKIGSDLKNSFAANTKFKKVVGIGGVFVFSIKQKLKKSVFTASEIDQWIQENHKKTDAEFNDKYAATIVTNMILVSEMMKILRIESIEALDVALVEGLLAKD